MADQAPSLLEILMNFLKGGQSQNQTKNALTDWGVGTFHYNDPRAKAARAYSRITQNPIYYNPDLREGAAGQYDAGSRMIEVQPSFLATPGVVSHESAHAIFDRANLYDDLPSQLVSNVPATSLQRIFGNPSLYPDPSAKTLLNEGLAYSIGDPNGTAYVNKVASKIQNLRLRDQLLRLHQGMMQATPLPQDVIHINMDGTGQ